MQEKSEQHVLPRCTRPIGPHDTRSAKRGKHHVSRLTPTAANATKPHALPTSVFLPSCMECRRDENSVCPSVCPSVKRVLCDTMEERSVQTFISYERPFSLVFLEEEWLAGGRPLLPEILGQLAPVGAKSPIFNLSRNT